MTFLSPNARRFLARYVDSPELLDILQLLARNPDQWWTVDALSDAVFTVPSSAQRRIDALLVNDLVATLAGDPPQYRLDVKEATDRASLDELSHKYRENRARVIQHVFLARTDPVQSFANALRLRKE